MNQSEDCRVVVARRYTRRDERLKIVETMRQSGLSAAEFAKQRGIPVRKLYRWRNAPLPAQTAAAFIELPAIATGSWMAEVTSKAGGVRLSGSASPVWAASLIRELNRC
jgi:hypothetical protein